MKIEERLAVAMEALAYIRSYSDQMAVQEIVGTALRKLNADADCPDLRLDYGDREKLLTSWVLYHSIRTSADLPDSEWK